MVHTAMRMSYIRQARRDRHHATLGIRIDHIFQIYQNHIAFFDISDPAPCGRSVSSSKHQQTFRFRDQRGPFQIWNAPRTRHKHN